MGLELDGRSERLPYFCRAHAHARTRDGTPSPDAVIVVEAWSGAVVASGPDPRDPALPGACLFLPRARERALAIVGDGAWSSTT